MEQMKTYKVTNGQHITGHDPGQENCEAQISVEVHPAIDIDSRLVYKIHDIPAWPIIIIYAVQQILANIGGSIAAVYIIHGQLCAQGGGADVVFARLLSTAVFMSGIGTLLQVTIGVRLPVVQGSSTSFVAPIVAMAATEVFHCPEAMPQINDGFDNHTMHAMTNSSDSDEIWMTRMQIISGSLFGASLLQVILGSTGLIGGLMHYVGPLTIAPTVTLVGLALFQSVSRAAQSQWGITVLFVALLLFFSFCLGKLRVPIPGWSRQQGCFLAYSPVFKLFPHTFAIIVCWTVTYILTLSGVFSDDPGQRDFRARTDAKLDVIYKSSWFFVPYPLQWGGLQFSSGLFAGIIAAGFASTIESVGDYYATARISEVPIPPRHAVNRGVLVEGLISVLAALVGSGHATTSYSATVGFIGITGVASRVIWQVMGGMLIVLGVFGKFGAAVSILPDPILAGLAIVSFGMVVAVGLSNLQFIDWGSARNLAVLGISIILGLMVPFWLRDNPGVIKTGIEALDQVLTVLLGTGMLVAGGLGFILDNLLPGTREERGIDKFTKNISDSTNTKVDQSEKQLQDAIYNVPLLSYCLKRSTMCSYIPFLPSYGQSEGDSSEGGEDAEEYTFISHQPWTDKLEANNTVVTNNNQPYSGSNNFNNNNLSRFNGDDSIQSTRL